MKASIEGEYKEVWIRRSRLGGDYRTARVPCVTALPGKPCTRQRTLGFTHTCGYATSATAGTAGCLARRMTRALGGGATRILHATVLSPAAGALGDPMPRGDPGSGTITSSKKRLRERAGSAPRLKRVGTIFFHEFGRLGLILISSIYLSAFPSKPRTSGTKSMRAWLGDRRHIWTRGP